MVSVADTGAGMPPEVLARAFDPFFTTKEVGKGTGLGLSMVYGFVRQSRGHVRIESEEGQGTCVRLFLPRWHGAPAKAPQSGREAGREIPEVASDGLILVVEDDPEVRRLTVQMLADLGHQVIEAADPHAALDLIEREEGIRLLFSDVVMPDVDGRRLAELARKLRPDLKVLLTTGYAPSAVLRDDPLAGGLALLPKPFTLEQVAAKLREVLA